MAESLQEQSGMILYCHIDEDEERESWRAEKDGAVVSSRNRVYSLTDCQACVDIGRHAYLLLSKTTKHAYLLLSKITAELPPRYQFPVPKALQVFSTVTDLGVTGERTT